MSCCIYIHVKLFFMSEIVPKVQNAARRYTFFIIIVKNYFHEKLMLLISEIFLCFYGYKIVVLFLCIFRCMNDVYMHTL